LTVLSFVINADGWLIGKQLLALQMTNAKQQCFIVQQP